VTKNNPERVSLIGYRVTPSGLCIELFYGL